MPAQERSPLLGATHQPWWHQIAIFILFFLLLSTVAILGPWLLESPTTTSNLPFEHLHNFCANVSPISAEEYLVRQRRLAQVLLDLNSAAFIAEPGPSMTYYTNVEWNLSERPFLVVIRPDPLAPSGVNVTFVSPAFEAARARNNIKRAALMEPVGLLEWQEHLSPYDPVAEILSTVYTPITTVYLDATVRLFIASGLANTLAPLNVTTLVSAPKLQTLRSIKSTAEIAILRCANLATVEALRAVRRLVKPGVTESQITAWTYEALKSAGLTMTWVLALVDENTAYPHGEPGIERNVGDKGSVVLIDAGGRFLGYESDITRTFFVPPSDPSLALNATRLSAWHAVHTAQERALSAIRADVPCSSVDLAARNYLADAGLAPYFTHRLGHGIGLEGHEPPYLNQGNTETRLEPGMTFSVEPGVYVLGEFGIRLEDIVVVSKDGRSAELLSGALANGPLEF